MKMIDVMKQNKPYCSSYSDNPSELQTIAKTLCWKYNQTSPSSHEERAMILDELLGTYNPSAYIEPMFFCDYGFNIHMKGFVFINHNCVILDTSPVIIVQGVFIGPGVCIACAGHAIHTEQRLEGIGTSSPITIEDNVWIGANATLCGGVTIGESSIVGAGSVVKQDIPSGVIAAGVPCKVIREVTDADRIDHGQLFHG
ncbi:sugar O-acetyltransferase [Anaerorhabdus sp.]|uniref:sugar O-acetyltransferase n=1 Tax=Anaerorhabdus sp. TaxID=1872524 RepID=UPI002FCB30A7